MNSFPYSNDTTSKAAAQTVDPHRATSLREQIFHLVQTYRNNGICDAEIQNALDLDGNTERPRRRELVQAGRIKDSGKRTLLTSSRQAILWTTV